MKKLIVASALSGALGSAYAAEDALHDSRFSDLGTVETIREVRITNPLRDAFEHALNPDTAHELVIRIDDGRAVVLRQGDLRRFGPGERVRLVWDSVPRLEHP